MKKCDFCDNTEETLADISTLTNRETGKIITICRDCWMAGVDVAEMQDETQSQSPMV